MPSAEQNSMNLPFSNSFPWSLLILTIPHSFYFRILRHTSLNTSKVSDFSLIKFIHVNLEKSSTHTKAYFFPPRLSTCIGPIRSLCSSSRTFVVVWYCNLGCDFLVC